MTIYYSFSHFELLCEALQRRVCLKIHHKTTCLQPTKNYKYLQYNFSFTVQDAVSSLSEIERDARSHQNFFIYYALTLCSSTEGFYN